MSYAVINISNVNIYFCDFKEVQGLKGAVVNWKKLIYTNGGPIKITPTVSLIIHNEHFSRADLIKITNSLESYCKPQCSKSY